MEIILGVVFVIVILFLAAILYATNPDWFFTGLALLAFSALIMVASAIAMYVENNPDLYQSVLRDLRYAFEYIVD